METNYKDRLIQSLKDELERVRTERDALREKLEQVEEECNRLEDEVADRRKDVEARDRVILELSRPSSCEGDLISRSALVDEIERTTWYHINELGELGEGANSELHTPLYKADDVYNALEQAPTVDAVEVKCKVGDLVYALWEAPVKLKYIIYCAEVKEIRISMRNCRLTTTYILEPIEYRGRRREYRDADFGTLVFKNEEDAERKLYPCEHCFSGTYRSCDGCSYGERKMVNLEDVVDIEAQTKANNEAMRKVVDFMVGERRTDV